MGTYGQFCPVAKAMELLDERWTLLVVRELLCGSRHFNELRRGVPRMSPALLSKRLRTLVQAGVVERREDGNRVEYLLTPAGEELEPIVAALGTWGTRWIPELGEEHLDPHLLLWDIHRNLDLDAMPPTRTVLAFHLHDARPRARDWWMVVTDREVDLCDDDPGYDVTARIEASLPALTRTWLGELSWEREVGAGSITVFAPTDVRRALPTWLKLSSFAHVPRPSTTVTG
jgi:DNA-binding HxlR family transcriptional regulator